MPASGCVAHGQQLVPVGKLGAGDVPAERDAAERLADAEKTVAEYHQLDAEPGQRQHVSTAARRLATVQVEHQRLVPRRARRRFLRRRSLLLQLLSAATQLDSHERICKRRTFYTLTCIGPTSIGIKVGGIAVPRPGPPFLQYGVLPRLQRALFP